MQANTKEVRNIVRAAAKELGVVVGKTWTDNAKSLTDLQKCYVAFSVSRGDANVVVKLAARMLSERGFNNSIRARTWQSRNYWGETQSYIRVTSFVINGG